MAKKPDRPDAKTASPPKGPSAEDVRLFRAAMADAERLPGRDDQPPPGPRTARPARAPAPAGPGAPAGPAGLPELEPGVAAGLDKRTMGRLRRGQMRPEARLDLHGMTRKEAYAALSAFIPRAQADGRRCVVVITGKGRVSEGGGVLRNEVPGWLNAPAIRHNILGFAAAQPRDGGAGALYVLLRRARGPQR